MADTKISAATLVVTPSATDEYATNKGGVSSRTPRALIHKLESGEHFILPQVSEVATPTWAFGDGDSGFHEPSDDVMEWVLGGGVAFKMELVNGRVQVTNDMRATVVASSTQTQGQQTLFSSYNEVSSVVTTDDVVTLPPAALGKAFTLINNGGNRLQVFPETDDDVGAGANTAITVEDGEILILLGLSAVVWNVLKNGPAATPAQADPLLLGDGTVGAPSYSFASETGTGLTFLGSDRLGLIAAGTLIARADGDDEQFQVLSGAVGEPGLAFITDSNTGIRNAGADELSLIAGGVEIARAIEAVSANQFGIVASGDPDVPDLTGLADLDTGFRWTGANQIDVVTAASISWSFSSAKFFSALSDGPCIANVAANTGVAIFRPDQADINTGLGANGADGVALIAGGIVGLAIKELNSGVLQVPAADVAITAFATGGQGSAVALKQSYNVISVCATTADSVKLPDVFLVNSVITIKNDGAESCDVFPATGDDLGQGLNTAEALASGVSASYIATAANATWTLLLASGGGADPLLLGGGSAGAPTYSFSGDPDTGVFSASGDVLMFATGGVRRFFINTTQLTASTSGGPALVDAASGFTAPTLLPNATDVDSGIGSDGSDSVSLIAGGVEALRFTEVSSGILSAPAGDMSVTALAGGGQGGAGILTFSYNVIDVVATTGDSVTLPAAFAVNTIIHIKNDGANSADVFPGAGDDLGAGADTAAALAAGVGIIYIATVANTTWTQLI